MSLFTDRRATFRIILAASFWIAFTCLFLPFWREILLAGVFALAVEPALGRLFRPRHLRWRGSVAFIFLGMFGFLSAPVMLVIYKISVKLNEVSKIGFQNTELFAKLIGLRDAILRILDHYANINVDFFSEERLGTLANSSLSVGLGIVSQVPHLLISIFVFSAAFYFFVAEAGFLKRVFYRQGLLNASEYDRLVDLLQDASYATVVSSVLVGLIQGAVVGLGAYLIAGYDIVVVFVLTFIFSFVPLIGAGPVALSLALYELLMGSTGPFIGLLIVAGVAGVTDNLARTFFLSSVQEDLHPFVSLLAIVGSLFIFGMPGLFLGPVIATVAVRIIPVLYGAKQNSLPPPASVGE